MRTQTRRHDRGFTLIEAIMVIVAAAILGAMMFTYSSTSLFRSSQPLHQATKALALQKVMENILADYSANYKANLAGIKTKIGSPGSPQTLTNSYGTYTLVYNDFVKFVAGAETPINTAAGDPQNMLKVTIRNDSGETLSILLTLIQ
ncbi:MAG: hypothetical protein A4E73_01533 [Syntrophaceae bacterium PtaU1.Bin231]|nr:MAG: hypothetical protein A4E73_01533 [Syntrophaceae bacterium PtaU1.Bin231]HOG17680.1 type II secretion system protein [Syntrophales bacterium]